jgi:hypothetical protein
MRSEPLLSFKPRIVLCVAFLAIWMRFGEAFTTSVQDRHYATTCPSADAAGQHHDHHDPPDDPLRRASFMFGL